MALYHYSIQRFLDQWFGKVKNKSEQQTKERRRHSDTRAKAEQKNRDKQSQQQSKGRTEDQKHEDERYFEAILGLKGEKTPDHIKIRCGERYFHAKTLDQIDDFLSQKHPVKAHINVEIVNLSQVQAMA